MYNDLEYRMHIAPTFEVLETLRAEGEAYFEDEILDEATPHGFSFKWKWDREYYKRSDIFNEPDL